MAKKLTIEQWMNACKKVIDEADCDGLRKILDCLKEEERYLTYPCMEEVVEYAAKKGNMEVLKMILEDEEFAGMRSHLMKEAIETENAELLDLALEYVMPNELVFGCTCEHDERMKCYLTAEPLAIFAIRGNVELAKVLLERGASPEGMTAKDILGRKTKNPRAFCYSKMEIHLRWNEGKRMVIERGDGLKRLPPWAYGMFCQDIAAAEFFLGLGEDRYTLELAMAVSMVSDGNIIRILREKKPKLMAAIQPKYILRRFWPEAVKQYFFDGREIPENAVALMGMYLFEECDVRDDHNSLNTMGFREGDFVETLKFLLTRGYRLTGDDVEQLTMWMVFFRSERLLNLLKGRIPKGMDVSAWIDYLPLEEKAWGFGKKLLEAEVKFRCVIDEMFRCYSTKHYMELSRLFKLVDFEVQQPEKLDCMSASALFTRSKRSMALLWKHGLINPTNLPQAVKLICDLQLTELYEFSAELAGTTGGSEVRYEL